MTFSKSIQYTLGILGIALLFFGFFTPKPILQDINTIPTNSRVTVDQMIIMIVDGLRWDMVQPMPDRKTHFHNQLSRAFNYPDAKHFFLETGPPSSTKPRVRALTTGQPPSYIEIIKNFGNEAALSDSVISSMHRNGKKKILRGDYTWLNLFPDEFDEVHSSYGSDISDFYEIDNITLKNLDTDLIRDDWDFMVIHLLGFDHVSHYYEPDDVHSSIKLKQYEELLMDLFQWTKQASRSPDSPRVTKRRKMVMLMGDHGMDEEGNHGGGSYDEIMSSLLLVCPECDLSRLEEDTVLKQIDLPSTIACLFNVSIPFSNTGVPFDMVDERCLSAVEIQRDTLREKVGGSLPSDKNIYNITMISVGLSLLTISAVFANRGALFGIDLTMRNVVVLAANYGLMIAVISDTFIEKEAKITRAVLPLTFLDSAYFFDPLCERCSCLS
ncbi:hypothetical protein PCE1_001095 [Barthelona sp. PCE]